MTHFKVSDEVLEAAARIVAKVTGEDYDSLGEFTQGVLKDTQRQCFEAALQVMFKQVAFGIKYEWEGADRFEVRDLSLNRDIAEEAVHLAQSRIAPNWPVKVSAVPLYCGSSSLALFSK